LDATGPQQWFGIGPASGISSPVGPFSFTVTPIGSGLSAGVYGGLLAVQDAAGDNPRLVTATLRVVPTAETVQRRVEPAGLSFVARAGAPEPPRTVVVRRNRGGAAPYLAAASTADGGSWLGVIPSNSESGQDGAVNLSVGVNPFGLNAGMYRGRVSITFGDGQVESAAVLLIVPPSAACTATQAAILPVSPAEGFRAFTGRAVRLEAEIWNDCGQPVENASVLASFNTGDSAVPLRPVSAGRYSGTWAPANAGSQANVVFTAAAGTFAARTFVVGTAEGAAHPVISSGGVVNAGGFARGEAIAPGAIVSVFGRNFQPAQESAEAVPLPTELGGLRMWLGASPAPLYFKNATQVNAQAPFELAAGSTAQAVVEASGAYSLPDEFPVARTRPDMFSVPGQPERAIVQFQNGALSGPETPVRPGDAVTVYLSGIGDTDPAVATNAEPPAAEPFARAVSNVNATIGGRGAAVLFLGLSPGFVGLAQANLVIPPDAPAGPNVPLILYVGDQPSKPLFISVGADQP
jgi:uncharacterized protein (TIGR03437 family)